MMIDLSEVKTWDKPHKVYIPSKYGKYVDSKDLAKLLEKSHNSEYVPPTAKSCTGCKHEWAHARCLMCERNFKDEYEGA